MHHHPSRPSSDSTIETIFNLLVVAIATLGIADASYLTYEKMRGIIPVCGPGFDCGAVVNSPWAYLGPIPVSVFGLAFYSAVFFLGICLYLGTNPFSAIPFWPRFAKPFWLLRALTGLGLLFSFYLVILMAFIIEAWCLYCLISALSSGALFLVTMFWHINRQPPSWRTMLNKWRDDVIEE